MSATNRNLTAAVETYFSDLARTRASGGATGELSYHTPLANLLGAVGGALKPKAFCVPELADQGAGHPDFGLYAAKQIQKGKPREGQTPERGVVEVKSADDDAWLTAEGEQVSRYWNRYRLVLVTNTRDFALVGERAGRPIMLERFRLAESMEDFERRLNTPRAFARSMGAGLAEYLTRALSHQAAIAEPKDLAWLLASYARDGLSRVERIDASGDALAALRGALEEGLGVRFEGERGLSFFHSTLVQTLFYGVFSAWVLWARQTPQPTAKFNWHEAVWHLRAPVLAALFQEVAAPNRLQLFDLVEVLDWTSAALDRVDREAFFARFSEGEAVPYFYEPFLEAFDPALRKQLGVWYTPNEVVRYMVARVDKALKDDLGIADGLAAENVYRAWTPAAARGPTWPKCCGVSPQNLEAQGVGALAGARVKSRLATERVFGFEIMPAPFVVAHLQVGLALDGLGAPLADNERAGVFLTNALTGWEPHTNKPLPFPELEEERDRAERVKQETPVLVILGNPPYNGFAGMAVDEERELSAAYRTTGARKETRGAGAERPLRALFSHGGAAHRREDGPGRRVLHLQLFMARRAFLHRNARALSRSLRRGADRQSARRPHHLGICPRRANQRNGLCASRAIARHQGRHEHRIVLQIGGSAGASTGGCVQYRDFHQAKADERRQALLESLDIADIDAGYSTLEPNLQLGLPFKPTKVSEGWFDWPALPDLFPVSFPGVKTSRDSFLVDTDLDRLKARIADYFDPSLSHEEIAQRYPRVMQTTRRFNPRNVRDTLLARGGPNEDGFIRFAYRPFDTRWLYWEKDTKLLDEKRADYRPHVFEGNVWLSAAQHLRKGIDEPQACFTQEMASLHLIERTALMFPTWLRDDGLEATSAGNRPNLSEAAQGYLKRVGASVEDLFHHALATLHDPAYREANAGALRMEWPRIPLPGWPNGGARRRCGNFKRIRRAGTRTRPPAGFGRKRSRRNAGSPEA